MPDTNEKQNKYTFTKTKLEWKPLDMLLATLGTLRSSLNSRNF